MGITPFQKDKGKASPFFLVALSGGADSVALLRILLFLGFPCHAIHCNFHLRGEASDTDESFAVELCKKLEVGLSLYSFDTYDFADREGISIEMAARELRYSAFKKESSQRGGVLVAIGHHLSDNMETLIQHLSEGCGIGGLRGIPPQRDCFIRPLIDCKKQEILDFLTLLGQPYCIDQTNEDTGVVRNFIRARILPLFRELNPSVEDAFRRTFTTLREAEALNKLALEQLIQEVRLNADGSIFDARKIASSPAPLSLLYAILSPLGFSRQRVELFVHNLCSPEVATIESSQYRVIRRGYKLHIFPLEDDE